MMITNTLNNIVKLNQNQLKGYVARELKNRGRVVDVGDGYVYSKGSLPVMLVAHLDTVHQTPVKTICMSSDNNVIMSPQGIGGDDRCGVAIIFELLNRFNCSVLFTEDEEIGCIGAYKFTQSYKKLNNINFMIEFDRKGCNDAVFYDCDNKEFTDFITNFGFVDSWGSFSDISILSPFYGVASVNLSSGYYDAHTRYERIVISDMRGIVKKASKILTSNLKKYDYIARKSIVKTYSSYTTGGYFEKSYKTKNNNTIKTAKTNTTSNFNATAMETNKNLRAYIKPTVEDEFEVFDIDLHIGATTFDQQILDDMYECGFYMKVNQFGEVYDDAGYFVANCLM